MQQSLRSTNQSCEEWDSCKGGQAMCCTVIPAALAGWACGGTWRRDEFKLLNLNCSGQNLWPSFPSPGGGRGLRNFPGCHMITGIGMVLHEVGRNIPGREYRGNLMNQIQVHPCEIQISDSCEFWNCRVPTLIPM
jgi:hypothetical protein